MVYKHFDKKSAGSDIKFMSNQILQMNSINELLANLKDEKPILLLKRS